MPQKSAGLSVKLTGSKTFYKQEANFSESTLDKIRESLTFDNPEYAAAKRYAGYTGSISKFLCYYYEDVTKIVVPREYPLEAISGTLQDRRVEFPFSRKFKANEVSLREYQEDYFKQVNFEEESFILEVPCGHGKTIMAFHIISKWKQKTLVVAPKNYLLKQWKSKAKTMFGFNAEILKNDPKKLAKLLESKEWDILLTTPQTLARVIGNTFGITLDYTMYNHKDIDNSIYNSICKYLGVGACVCDEVHRMGAKTFAPLLSVMDCKRRVALTATMRRKDGMDKLVRYHFGNAYTMEYQFEKVLFQPFKTGVFITKPREQGIILSDLEVLRNSLKAFYAQEIAQGKNYFIFTETFFDHNFSNSQLLEALRKKAIDKNTFEVLTYKPTNLNTYMDTFCLEHPTKYKQYQSLITEAMLAGRTILVLSKRKEKLKRLYDLYKEKYKCALLIEDTYNKEYEKMENYLNTEAQIVFATNQIAEEGLDIDRLDTLLLLQPITDVEQAIGRIARYHPNKKKPMALYPIDNCYFYKAIYKQSAIFAENNSEVLPPISFIEVKKALHD